MNPISATTSLGWRTVLFALAPEKATAWPRRTRKVCHKQITAQAVVALAPPGDPPSGQVISAFFPADDLLRQRTSDERWRRQISPADREAAARRTISSGAETPALRCLQFEHSPRPLGAFQSRIEKIIATRLNSFAVRAVAADGAHRKFVLRMSSFFARQAAIIAAFPREFVSRTWPGNRRPHSRVDDGICPMLKKQRPNSRAGTALSRPTFFSIFLERIAREIRAH